MPYLSPYGGNMAANSFSLHPTLSEINKKKEYPPPPPPASSFHKSFGV